LSREKVGGLVSKGGSQKPKETGKKQITRLTGNKKKWVHKTKDRRCKKSSVQSNVRDLFGKNVHKISFRGDA